MHVRSGSKGGALEHEGKIAMQFLKGHAHLQDCAASVQFWEKAMAYKGSRWVLCASPMGSDVLQQILVNCSLAAKAVNGQSTESFVGGGRSGSQILNSVI